MLLKNWESAFTLVRLVPTQKFTFSQITEVFFESRHDYIVIQSRLILTNLTPVPPGGWRPIEKGCGPHHNSLPAQSTLADRCQGARHWQARCLRGARRSRPGRMLSHGSGFTVFDIYLLAKISHGAELWNNIPGCPVLPFAHGSPCLWSALPSLHGISTPIVFTRPRHHSYPFQVSLRRQLREGFLGETIHLVDARIECGSILEETYSWCPSHPSTSSCLWYSAQCIIYSSVKSQFAFGKEAFIFNIPQ